ncbi:DUF3617 domain-containing protein [Sphingomonas sp.]|uniref:DUF3617 domain-containing protein n=1 Tax=Sphingomonas sp. TaxID=28214 RepID=UPI0035C860DF
MNAIGRAAFAVSALLAGAAAGAQGGSVLAGVVPGEWALHDIGQRGTARQICVRDPAQLVHVNHPTGACRRSLVSREGRVTTIRYVCPGLGNGITRLTMESSSIVRIQTQGLVRGAPFDRDMEARRTGACRRGLTAFLPD